MGRQDCVPKLIGGDVELGNFILGPVDSSHKTDYQASRLLLRQVNGLPLQRSPNDSYAFDWHSNAATIESVSDGGLSQDSGRRYLPCNGGCIYIDLNHLELATAEVLSARDYQAMWTAMLRLARHAQLAANQKLADGKRIVVLANNSDRQGKSYGGHQSFLMSRSAWDGMIRLRMMPSLFYLMAFQVSSIVFTGQGKVGSENGQPWAPFQISQRADFIETLLSVETTVNRPLVNTRDEPLSGPKSRRNGGHKPGDRFARLHVIFYDTNLAPVATYLKVGVMQLILTMIEAEFLDDSLTLEKPLDALHAWSRDPDLGVRMRLVSGQQISAVELQLKFLEQAKAFDARHGFEEFVEGAAQIIALWEDTLLKLQSQDMAGLRGRIDWIMKRALLEQALVEHPQWDWDSTELTYLDQIYSSLDPDDGLFVALQDAGHFEAVANEAEIAAFVSEPPANTRAWTRAMLLRAIDPEQVTLVDWDRIVMRCADAGRRQTQIDLPDPLGATRSTTEHAFSDSADFTSLLQRLHEVGVKTSTTENVSTGMTVYPIQGYHHPYFNHRY